MPEMITVKEKKKSKIKTVVCYVVGSAVLCAVAVVAMPKVMSYVSGAINKNMARVNNAKKSDDDWGPVIEKKRTKINDEEE